MFPHTVWTEGAHRAARYHDEADVRRMIQAAQLGSLTRRAVAHALRRSADLLAATADRLVPASNPTAPRAVRRPPATSA